MGFIIIWETIGNDLHYRLTQIDNYEVLLFYMCAFGIMALIIGLYVSIKEINGEQIGKEC